MTELSGLTDPLSLRLLPEINPDAADRRRAWDDFLAAGAMKQLSDFISYKNGTGMPNDDILQETLTLAWRKVEGGDYAPQPAPFVAYLKAIASFKILEAARQRAHTPLDDFEEVLPDPRAGWGSAEHIGERGALVSALNGLPPRRRDILLLSEVYDMTSEEIAQRLNIRADLVRKDKSLAVRQIRCRLAGDLPVPAAHAA